jgi:arginyl-tRNA--protein-N-Asp/Glu arginylyltransferase
VYKPSNDKCCCPNLCIRVDALAFTPGKQHIKCLKRVHERLQGLAPLLLSAEEDVLSKVLRMARQGRAEEAARSLSLLRWNTGQKAGALDGRKAAGQDAGSAKRQPPKMPGKPPMRKPGPGGSGGSSGGSAILCLAEGLTRPILARLLHTLELDPHTPWAPNEDELDAFEVVLDRLFAPPESRGGRAQRPTDAADRDRTKAVAAAGSEARPVDAAMLTATSGRLPPLPRSRTASVASAASATASAPVPLLPLPPATVAKLLDPTQRIIKFNAAPAAASAFVVCNAAFAYAAEAAATPVAARLQERLLARAPHSALLSASAGAAAGTATDANPHARVAAAIKQALRAALQSAFAQRMQQAVEAAGPGGALFDSAAVARILGSALDPDSAAVVASHPGGSGGVSTLVGYEAAPGGVRAPRWRMVAAAAGPGFLNISFLDPAAATAAVGSDSAAASSAAASFAPPASLAALLKDADAAATARAAAAAAVAEERRAAAAARLAIEADDKSDDASEEGGNHDDDDDDDDDDDEEEYERRGQARGGGCGSEAQAAQRLRREGFRRMQVEREAAGRKLYLAEPGNFVLSTDTLHKVLDLEDSEKAKQSMQAQAQAEGGAEAASEPRNEEKDDNDNEDSINFEPDEVEQSVDALRVFLKTGIGEQMARLRQRQVDSGSPFGPGPHRLEVTLHRPRYLKEAHELYARFNMQLHRSRPRDNTRASYTRHLVRSPLVPLHPLEYGFMVSACAGDFASHMEYDNIPPEFKPPPLPSYLDELDVAAMNLKEFDLALDPDSDAELARLGGRYPAIAYALLRIRIALRPAQGKPEPGEVSPHIAPHSAATEASASTETKDGDGEDDDDEDADKPPAGEKHVYEVSPPNDPFTLLPVPRLPRCILRGFREAMQEQPSAVFQNVVGAFDAALQLLKDARARQEARLCLAAVCSEEWDVERQRLEEEGEDVEDYGSLGDLSGCSVRQLLAFLNAGSPLAEDFRLQLPADWLDHPRTRIAAACQKTNYATAYMWTSAAIDTLLKETRLSAVKNCEATVRRGQAAAKGLHILPLPALEIPSAAVLGRYFKRRETGGRSADAEELPGDATDGPLIEVEGWDLSLGYGSFHHEYRLDGVLVAVTVLDILPTRVSSIYCFYNPDLRAALEIGKLSSLLEIWLTQQIFVYSSEHADDLLGVPCVTNDGHGMGGYCRWWDPNYYVHPCSQMAYKVGFRPCQLLDPAVHDHTWVNVTPAVIKSMDDDFCAPLAPRRIAPAMGASSFPMAPSRIVSDKSELAFLESTIRSRERASAERMAPYVMLALRGKEPHRHGFAVRNGSSSLHLMAEIAERGRKLILSGLQRFIYAVGPSIARRMVIDADWIADLESKRVREEEATLLKISGLQEVGSVVDASGSDTEMPAAHSGPAASSAASGTDAGISGSSENPDSSFRSAAGSGVSGADAGYNTSPDDDGVSAGEADTDMEDSADAARRMRDAEAQGDVDALNFETFDDADDGECGARLNEYAEIDA